MREWLVNIRKQKELTQKEVAEKSFIDRGYYAQIENNKRNPSFNVAKNIANSLGFNPSVFFMEHLEDPFQVALKNSPIIVAHCDLELRYTWIFNPHPDFSPEQSIGKRDDELDLNDGTMSLIKLKQDVIDKGTPIRRKITFPLSNGHISYDVFGEPLYDENGVIKGVTTVSTDITNY